MILMALTALPAAATGEAEETKKEKVATGGLKLEAVGSSYLIGGFPMSSSMNVGGALGGFVDFNVSKHFVIQVNLFGAYKQTDLYDTQQSRMSTWSIELPIYFLGRYSFADGSSISFGGGPYTEFILDGTLSNANGKSNPFERVVDQTEEGDVFALERNHSGLGITVGYEFPFGFQINASARMSLTDIIGYEHERPYCTYPYSTSVGIAYRFK